MNGRTSGRIPTCAIIWICVTFVVNGWALLGPRHLDLSGDEAHYWEWSRRPDLSYYSKGPLAAYLIAASHWALGDLSTEWFGDEMPAVRAPALVLSALTAWGVFSLSRIALRREGEALLALLLLPTFPILGAGSTLMTIDAPLVCCWTWALFTLVRAVEDDRIFDWLLTACLVGLGTLAKYTMVLFFPVMGAALFVQWRRRQPLSILGPGLVVLGALLGFAPIVHWNAAHGWVGFHHVAEQAGVSGLPSIRLAGVAEYLAGQLFIANPVWPFVLAWLTFKAPPQDFGRAPEGETAMAWRERAGALNENTHVVMGASTGTWPLSLVILVSAMLTPWLVFLLFSPITHVQPNWPVIALPPICILLARSLTRALRASAPSLRKAAVLLLSVGVSLGAFLTLMIRNSEIFYPLFKLLARQEPSWELTPMAHWDPAARLRGWSQLGREVGEEMRAFSQAERPPVIFADHYQLASELAFYVPGQPTVYCIQSVLGDRLCQYDLWPNPIDHPEAFLGRPALYIGRLPPESTEEGRALRQALPGLKRIRTVEHRVRGEPVRIGSVYYCDAFAGFGPRESGSSHHF